MKIGDAIGNNKITGEGISGGYGVVYPAYDEMLDRRVAIKVLHPSLLLDESRLTSFRNEARMLARLNHPNIATLYNLIEDGGAYYMVMEYVDGPTFHRLIKSKGAMPFATVVPLIIQALNGFAHAHAMRVIHRDIKPGNLMVNSEGVVKIMDFGIARHLGAERQTKTGVLGTTEYMSPEQIRATKLDERSDIYSIGVVMFEMLTGRVPFSGASEFDILRAHLESTPPTIDSIVKDVPKGIAQCVEIALRKDPAARFGNVAEFLTELQGAMAGGSPIAYFPTATTTVEQPVIEKKKRDRIAQAAKLRRVGAVIKQTVVGLALVGICIAAVMYGPQAWETVSKHYGLGTDTAKAAPAAHGKNVAGSSSQTKHSNKRTRTHDDSGHSVSYSSGAHLKGNDPTSAEADRAGKPKSGKPADTADTPADGADATPTNETPAKEGDDTTPADSGKGSEENKTAGD